jgi:hypothetical protein
MKIIGSWIAFIIFVVLILADINGTSRSYILYTEIMAAVVNGIVILIFYLKKYWRKS